MSEEFNEPRLAINRIYTRKGDRGTTRLVGGQKVGKASLRIESYGAVDELNSYVGQARVRLIEAKDPAFADLIKILLRLQHELFNLGSILATLPEDVHPQQPRVRAEEVERLEKEIDEANEVLAPLRSFVLPGGSLHNTDLHICRTVCRRVERLMVALQDSGEDVNPDAVAYINRLSDAFFVWSRWVMHHGNFEETVWDPNAVND